MTNCFIEIKPQGVLFHFAFAARQACKMELKNKWMDLGQLVQLSVIHKPNLGALSR